MLEDLKLAEIPMKAIEYTTAPPNEVTGPAGYNYASLKPEDAERLRKATGAIRACLDRAHHSIFEIGGELTAIKDSLPYGVFGSWLKAEFNMTARTAQNYMSAYRLRQESETVSVLPIKAVYALGAPGTPEGIKSEILSRLEAKDIPTEDEIIDAIADAKKKIKADTRPASIDKDVERMAAEQKQAAVELVKMLREKLGDDFQKFRALVRKAGPQFERILNALA